MGKTTLALWDLDGSYRRLAERSVAHGPFVLSEASRPIKFAGTLPLIRNFSLAPEGQSQRGAMLGYKQKYGHSK